MIELYDVGRVLIKPFEDGYRFIAEQGDKYIDDKSALEEIREFHRDRSRKLGQAAFDLLNYAWVSAIKNGEIQVNPKELVYPDVAPRINKVRARGDGVTLHTSGSKELVDLLIGDEFAYDNIIVASKESDKNNPETFAKIWEYLKGKVSAFYDDKPSVLLAAYEGFKSVSAQPRLYLVDRLNSISEEAVRDLKLVGVIKIPGFDEVKD